MPYLKLFLFVVLVAVMAGCTATQQDSTAKASLEWRIQSLEESFLNFREEQRRQADKSAEDSAAVEKKMDEMQAAIDTLKNGQNAADTPDDMAAAPQQRQGWTSDLKPDDGEWVEGGAAKAQETPGVAQSEEAKPWDKVPGPPAVIPEPKVIERKNTTVAATSKPKAAAPEAAPAVPVGPQKMYEAAYATYEKGNFEDARRAFDQFLQKYPKSSLVPNALYWKGETYYSQKNFPQAILAFKEVTGRFPKHAKSAAALLKIGMSYDRVGDPDNAIFYLRALAEDFPNSAPAKLGRKELTRLGG
ncbi:tol-pal system protein YbgF [Pseudodesulfovibrio sp.]|uniref:tol-pal system protein YbgF n=1 Tax=unclassified Pseudodesulfovibrio TaxID=2661612 RepID=UPI003B00F371